MGQFHNLATAVLIARWPLFSGLGTEGLGLALMRIPPVAQSRLELGCRRLTIIKVREVFLAWVRQVLVPTLKAGQIVITDNLGSHRGKANPL
jgi:hypothetical protein